MGYQVSQEVQTKILKAVRQAHVSNLERLQVWDSKVRSLYSAGSGLVNDGVESYMGYGQIQTALDVRLQSIVRRAWPFYKPPSSSSTSKPKNRGPSFAVACAKMEQKRRTMGKGRVIRGHSPQATSPPVSSPPSKPPTPVAKACQEVFASTDIRYMDAYGG